MSQKKFEELTDVALLQETKKIKSYKIYDAVIFGFLIGIAIYSSVNNGFGLLTFLPLLYLPVAARNKFKYDELKRLLKERGLG